MAIKISGTTVIDDSRNLISVGVATVGSGNSAITLDGTTGNLNVGTGVTINGSTGDINISGILTVGQLSIPVDISSFSPAIGATDVSRSTQINLTFNQTVGLGTTGSVEIRVGSATTGTLYQTIYPANTTLSNGGTVLNLNNDSSTLPDAYNEVFPVMSSGFVVANGSNFAGINTVGSGVTYSFTTKPVGLGDGLEGGYLICQSGGTRWIIAPSTTEVGRSWYSRNDALTTAEAHAACGDWFIPSCAQLQNPGFACRTYWDSYTAGDYWSNTELNVFYAWFVNMSTGNASHGAPYGGAGKPATRCVRAIRCFTY